MKAMNEAEFAASALEYFRRAGRTEAWKLAEHLADLSDDGCYREHLCQMLEQALAELPTKH